MTARLRVPLALLAVLCAALPAVASAATSSQVRQVVRDYRDDGKIDACKHSPDDLRDALDAVSADTEQYAPDFPAAIEAAIEAQASGECEKKAEGSPSDPAGAGAAPPGATPTPVPPAATPVPGATPAPGGEVVPEPPAPPPGGGITEGTPPPADNRPDTVLTRPVAARESDFATAPLIIVAALLAACLLAGIALLAMRRLGWGEERLAGARHAVAEAGYRTGGVWEDFTDWLRLGR